MTDAKWLNCRLDDLQEQLDKQGHGVSRPVIGRLLKAHDYRLHANAKELGGPAQPERNARSSSTSLSSAPSIWRRLSR
jgi:Rhodopirellula transposase DDE domain